jgi:signal transduction histidine kinase
VLDMAKVEAGKIDFSPQSIALSREIREVVEVLRPVAAQKRIEIRVDAAPAVDEVVLDPVRLHQVLYNYISNALKFSPDESKVTIRTAVAVPGMVRIEVEDAGIGIAPDDIGKLFGDFQQLDAGVAKRYQGAGLGLALTKRLVEAQGGSVGVLSTPGSGSTFFAILPRGL